MGKEEEVVVGGGGGGGGEGKLVFSDLLLPRALFDDDGVIITFC